MYLFRLTTGVTAQVDLDIDPPDVEASLARGSWFTDEHGWTINPEHVVMFKLTEETN